MAADTVVGVDLGTTALKACLFDTGGTLLAFAQAPYPIARRRSDWAEQDPDDWLRALSDSLGVLREQSGERAAAAVGICSQVNTHVFVDGGGAVLRPAIVWQDQRCGLVAADLNERLAAESPSKSGRFHIAASTLPARAGWVAREEPDIWQATRYILAPKDFVTARLCRLSDAVTDPITPFDLVDDAGVYDPDVVALVDGVADRLPEVRAIDACIGTVRDGDYPLVSHAAVVTGTMDAWGSVYGSGVVDHGSAMEVAGTSEILALFSRERHPTAGVVSFLPVDGLHLHAGPTQAGGDSVTWLASVAGLSISSVLDRAAEAPPGADGLIFLPHLLGERAPLWDGDARGAFVGLSSAHRTAHLCRAVLEGVAYSARHLLEALQEAGAVVPDELRASGGGSQSDLWCQIKADVLDLPVARLQVRHSGCLGAALIAATGAGLVDGGVRDVARETIRVERVFEPRADRGIYDALYGLYRELYGAMQPTYAALADLRRETGAHTISGGASG